MTKEAGVQLPAEFCGELFSIIDNFLTEISGRSLIDSSEVQDFCLDVRQLVASNMENKDEI